MSNHDMPIENLPDDHVVVVGGGPVGLVMALVLARHGIPSVLLERSTSVTRFPKMDLTLARSMEIFRQLGIADAIRSRGVSTSEPFIVRFSSGLGSDTGSLCTWDLPSVDDYRKRILANNDGSMPREPWQRIPGDAMERLLREECEASPLVSARYGWTVTHVSEEDDAAEVSAAATENKEVKIRARFAVGCDGANSVVRKSLGIALDGGPLTHAAHLVHFKSRDLTRLHAQGNFWHTFSPSDPVVRTNSLGGAIIAQDAKDTWTVHDYLTTQGYVPTDDNAEKNAKDTVARVLGGMGQLYPIDIDEIIAQSTFTPSAAISRAWSGPKHHVFLAGDAAHQTVPSGGYGMNMGLVDAWDLGWRLAISVRGRGGPDLLATYESERRPVARLMQHWGKVHGMKLMGLPQSVKLDPAVINRADQAGVELRTRINEYIQRNDDHNQSTGVEMGYRYESSLCFDALLDKFNPPPEFNNRRYTPTTHPGYRAPHVFLDNGGSIFDHYGTGFTLVTFTDTMAPSLFEAAAEHNGLALKVLHLAGEENARKVWGADLILVRPDGHVSWRWTGSAYPVDASRVLLQAVGHPVEPVEKMVLDVDKAPRLAAELNTILEAVQLTS